ncbi:hypothetical protein HK104_010813 [Borealophlyctis nickersoniae]|nr:hypothetical protein HK104_010813 [Borealophlyctis nickersoniae]
MEGKHLGHGTLGDASSERYSYYSDVDARSVTNDETSSLAPPSSPYRAPPSEPDTSPRTVKVYRCPDPACFKVYQSTDARNRHYRSHHKSHYEETGGGSDSFSAVGGGGAGLPEFSDPIMGPMEGSEGQRTRGGNGERGGFQWEESEHVKYKDRYNALKAQYRYIKRENELLAEEYENAQIKLKRLKIEKNVLLDNLMLQQSFSEDIA